MNRLVLLAVTLIALSAAREAAAQGFVSPFIGTTLSSPTATGSSTRAGYGISLGSLGKIVGAETEIAYFPELIDNSANALAKNKVFTVTGDTLIGPIIGRVKPYAAIGAGNLHLNVTNLTSAVLPTQASISNNYFTFNAGGGVIGFFTQHFGARGDLRYTRAFGIKVADLSTAGLSLDHFDYWRATFGVAVKF